MDAGRDGGQDDGDGVIQIELRLDGSLPTGFAMRPDGGTRAFTGWVGLMSAVDALTDDGSSMTGEDER